MSRAALPVLLPSLLLCIACGAGRDGATTSTNESGTPVAEPNGSAAPAPASAATPAPSGANGESVNVNGLVGGAPEAADPSANTSSSEPPRRSSGCGQPAPATGTRTVQVANTERSFLLDLPSDYDANVAYPLVFAFHGATTSGTFFRSARYGNLLSAMGAEAIVIHANALGDPTAWNTQADLPFFDAMLAQLEGELCVNEDRVFATGHSSGGFFSNTLGCQRGNVLRAIAPVAGGGPFTFAGASCTERVAVWLAHGNNDDVVPFATGVTSRDGWLSRNGCEAVSMALTSPAGCVAYAGCDADAPVRWCEHQDGHNWPDFAPQAIWDFFRSL